MKEAGPTVGDIMFPVLVTLRPERTLDEARALLQANGVVAAPVLSTAGSPMGVVTDFQLLKCFLKRSLQTPDKHQLMNYLTELEGITSIQMHEPATEGFKMMLANAARRIYVVNKDDKLVGALEPSSFFAMVMKEEHRKVASLGRKRLMPDGTLAELSIEESIFHDAPVTLHSLDFTGKIVAANDALHALLGYNRGELVGKTLKDLYAPQSHDDVTATLAKLRETGFRAPVNSAFARKDQSLVKIDLVTLVRYDGSGQAQGTITAGWLAEEGAMAEFLKVLSKAPTPPE